MSEMNSLILIGKGKGYAMEVAAKAASFPYVEPEGFAQKKTNRLGDKAVKSAVLVVEAREFAVNAEFSAFDKDDAADAATTEPERNERKLEANLVRFEAADARKDAAKAQDKAAESLRRGALIRSIIDEASFSKIKRFLTDDEKLALAKAECEMYNAQFAGKSAASERQSAARTFRKVRDQIITRLAQSPETTDAALGAV
jgi:hypothetical protein